MHIDRFLWFESMAAGITPDPLLLVLALLCASYGAWASVAVLGWVAWRHPHQRLYVLATLAACGVAAMLAHWLAASLDLPRPFMLGLSPAYLSHGARGSLPSAHASVMFSAAFILIARRPLRANGLLLALIALVTGWARVYVGVHFPMDIGAGIGLALGITGLFVLTQVLLRQAIPQRQATTAERT